MSSRFQGTIVVLGRPNVGKSSIFNRLVGYRKALVHNRPGVTRDRIEEEATWIIRGEQYTLKIVDTGGVGGELFDAEIQEQVSTALQDASLGLFVFDGREGLTDHDRSTLEFFRKRGVFSQIPVLGVVNKIDEPHLENLSADFFESGVDPLFTLSAEHNYGIEELKEFIIEKLELKPSPEEEKSEEQGPSERIPQIALVGKPNVGKSTLLNALLGTSRMVTSSIPGTTVDSIDHLVRLNDRIYRFIDTAGVRRKSKTEQGIEVLSVVQTRKALDRADLAILVLDGEKGIAEQDEKIGGLIEESGCSVLLAVNKWDTQRHNEEFDEKEATDRIRRQIRFLGYAPVVFISGKERRGLRNMGNIASDILNARSTKLETKDLTQFIREKAEIHNPKNAKFFLSHQTSRRPPTVRCHVNDPRKIHFSLKRLLIKEIREKWGLVGTPVRLQFTK